MKEFPRTTVGGISVSRLIIGTNWFLGWSHTTHAKDMYIKEVVGTRDNIASILEVYLKAGVDTIMGPLVPLMYDAIEEAKQRAGRDMIIVTTPHFTVGPHIPESGFDLDEAAQVLDDCAERGTTFCMPHQSVTDATVDRCTRTLRKMDQLCAMIRERGMVPGLSTHMPEAIIYSDESGLDVDTYISIYNSMGFLMQVEVDWIQRVIQNAKKPVMTIKPLAAGQLRPLQGLTFVWNTIRPQDMVTIGTISVREAQEVIDLSMEILERRPIDNVLQETRSKKSVKSAEPVPADD
jgi:hypothetical protein